MNRIKPDYPRILETIVSDIEPLLNQGKVADYIPPLAAVPVAQFGMAIETVAGERFSIGSAKKRFSIQSISKIFALTLALQRIGDALWQRVGREPSGTPFNSLVQLEHERGIPRNPFINAGALIVTDVLCSHFTQSELAVPQFVRDQLGVGDIASDPEVAVSEEKTGFRNAAMANFIKSFGNLHGPVDVVLRCYFQNCAIEMSCEELAKSALYLANHGIVPSNGQRVLTTRETKRVNAVLLTCGTYDAAGDFAYRVGLPAKSGVGGGIVAVLPGELAVCVWSPGLDQKRQFARWHDGPRASVCA